MAEYIIRKGWGMPLRWTDGDRVTEFTEETWEKNFPNFSPDEVCSKDDGSLRIQEHAMMWLQSARNKCDFAFRIRSAYRTQKHNDSIPGSVKNSRHVAGDGFDISVTGLNSSQRRQLHQALKDAMFDGFGFYPDSEFLHADTWRPRQWGDKHRFFKNLQTEHEPVEKSNKRNDKIVGGVSATALVGVAQTAMTSTLPVWAVIPIVVAVLGFGAWYLIRRI